MMNTTKTTAMSEGQNLFVETGETVLLSPDSQRFGPIYKSVYPRDVDEIRAILGYTEETATALKKIGRCCGQAAKPTLAAVNDLHAKEPAVRARARQAALQAATQYVRSADPSELAQWKPLIDKYLELGKVVIHYIVLSDIEVANGGTLSVSASTRALWVNNIKIHGTGRIVCHGDISIRCTTLQGLTPSQPTIPESILAKAS